MKKRRVLSQTKLPEKKLVFKSIQPLNDEQEEYIDKIRKHDITICTGRAGSGKTAIASGIAAEYLYYNRIQKIYLTRPCVGAEDLGYLPGHGEQKIHPYLMPLFEELGNFVDIKELMKSGQLEVVPLAYMRGRTLKNAFIVADEAQNASPLLLRMLLTRFGTNSKMVITGDVTQSDLPLKYANGFTRVIEQVVRPIESPGEICVVNLQKSVRHPLVEKIDRQFSQCNI